MPPCSKLIPPYIYDCQSTPGGVLCYQPWRLRWHRNLIVWPRVRLACRRRSFRFCLRPCFHFLSGCGEVSDVSDGPTWNKKKLIFLLVLQNRYTKWLIIIISNYKHVDQFHIHIIRAYPWSFFYSILSEYRLFYLAESCFCLQSLSDHDVVWTLKQRHKTSFQRTNNVLCLLGITLRWEFEHILSLSFNKVSKMLFKRRKSIAVCTIRTLSFILALYLTRVEKIIAASNSRNEQAKWIADLPKIKMYSNQIQEVISTTKYLFVFIITNNCFQDGKWLWLSRQKSNDKHNVNPTFAIFPFKWQPKIPRASSICLQQNL